MVAPGPSPAVLGARRGDGRFAPVLVRVGPLVRAWACVAEAMAVVLYYHARLSKSGNSPESTLGAWMRKLPTILSAILQDHVPWQSLPVLPSSANPSREPGLSLQVQ